MAGYGGQNQPTGPGSPPISPDAGNRARELPGHLQGFMQQDMGSVYESMLGQGMGTEARLHALKRLRDAGYQDPAVDPLIGSLGRRSRIEQGPAYQQGAVQQQEPGFLEKLWNVISQKPINDVLQQPQGGQR